MKLTVNGQERVLEGVERTNSGQAAVLSRIVLIVNGKPHHLELDPRTHERQHLSVRRVSQYRRCHSGRCRGSIPMKPFTYERVTDPRAAGAAVSRAGAKFISGGTNLLDLMKLEIEQPTHLVDISRLPLKQVEDLPDGGIRIGAQSANSEVAADPRVR